MPETTGANPHMTSESLVIRTRQLIESGDYAQARQALETHLSAKAGDARALDLLCKLADHSGDYAHAADWLCRSLEIDTHNHRAYCLFG